MAGADNQVLHKFVPTALALPSSYEEGKYLQIGDSYWRTPRTLTTNPLLEVTGNNPKLDISILANTSGGETVSASTLLRLKDCAEVKVSTGSLPQTHSTVNIEEIWAGKKTLPHQTDPEGRRFGYLSFSLKGVPPLEIQAEIIGEVTTSKDSIALMPEGPRRIVEQLSSQSNDLELITTWSLGSTFGRLDAFVYACNRIPSRLPAPPTRAPSPDEPKQASRGPVRRGRGGGRGGHINDIGRPRPQYRYEKPTTDDSDATFCVSNGTEEQSFTMDRKKLSASSEHYNSMLVESEQGNKLPTKIMVSAVDPWIFSAFHCYVEKDRVELGIWKHDIPGHTISTPDDPTRWSWSILADCYIFGETCGAPGLRQRILEIMQMKYYQKYPVVAKFPTHAALGKIYRNTKSGSSIRRLLVYMRLDMPALATSGEAADFNMSCPQNFLAETMTLMERRTAAASCGACFVDSRSSSKKTCTSTSHSLQDLKTDTFNDWCLCHEHNNEQDKKACQERREANEYRFADTIICD